jgi:hypothetical protein
MKLSVFLILALLVSGCATSKIRYGATPEGADFAKEGVAVTPRKWRPPPDTAKNYKALKAGMRIQYEDLLEKKRYDLGFRDFEYYEIVSPFDAARRENFDTQWVKYFMFLLPITEDGKTYRYAMLFRFERFYFDAGERGSYFSGWYTEGRMELFTIDGIKLGIVDVAERGVLDCKQGVCVFYYRGDKEKKEAPVCYINFGEDVLLPDSEHPILRISKDARLTFAESWDWNIPTP